MGGDMEEKGHKSAELSAVFIGDSKLKYSGMFISHDSKSAEPSKASFILLILAMR
jgi:hypothetical protein